MKTDDPVKKAIQIAVYTRKSNDENLTGEVTSIDNQKNCCRSYISIQKEKGWQEYSEAFDDPAESGKNLNRPAMKRLLRAIQEERVHGVIVYKLDRLTRNSKDFHYLLELFEKHSVAFISATESIDTKSPQGRLMTAIMVQFAQYDRELDQERSKDFHLARAKKGLWCAGLPPMGYDIKEKMLIVNEAEAVIVRRIFDLYLRFKSTLKVAHELNREGLRRKTHKTQDGKLFGGKPFDPDSVIRILQRKVYIGFITNSRSGQEFTGQHKPIVPVAVFERVQKYLEAHAKREEAFSYAVNKHGFKLKGLVRCGECNNAIVGYARPKKNKVYRYYRCLSISNGLPISCPVKNIGADKLEEFVIEKLAGVGFDQTFLEKVVQKVSEKSRDGLRLYEKERRALEEVLKGINREIQNLLNLVKATSCSTEAQAEIARLEASKREIVQKLAEMEVHFGRNRQAVYDMDVIQGALQRFARFIYKLPFALQAQTLQLLIKRVTLYMDKIHVELHELPVDDLERALNAKKIPQFDAAGTAVAELGGKWRGRRELNPRSLP